MDETDAGQQRMDFEFQEFQPAPVVRRQSNADGSIARGTLLSEAVYRLKHPQKNENEEISRPKDSSTERRLSVSRPLQNRHYVTAMKEKTSREENPDDMVLRLSNEFQPIIQPDWDTVVFIGPPPQEHQQDDYEYEYIKQHFSKPYLMNSLTLKETQSAQFDKFLGPMSARAERRLKKLGIHNSLPPNRKAKYYIDLRPMQDEDEALLMITELTCTPGVLSWHMSHLASGVPRTLIAGRDELNVTSKPHSKPWIEIDDSTGNDIEDEKTAEDRARPADEGSDILDLERDYSALRHCTAIERLLHAIAGQDPKLNSAPKVWTYFAIAKFFDCATNPKVSTWIYEWLLTANNSNFLQANPEVGYRMALGMRSPDILRTTYAMLVGERALMQAGRSTVDSIIVRPGADQVSVHGRRMNHLDDDEINRIDHAASSLIKRMTHLFDTIANGPLNWTSSYSELAKFDFLWESFYDKSIIDQPFSLLQEYTRGEIYQALSQNVQEGELNRLYRTKGHREFGWLKRSRSFSDAYNRMSLPQRLLTQTFWSQLENYGLYQEPEKTIAWTYAHSLSGLSDLAPDFKNELCCVPKADLCGAIELMNEQLARDKKWVMANKQAWNIVAMRAEVRRNQPESYQNSNTSPAFDEELVRAMQGLGMLNANTMPGYTDQPFNGKTYTDAYPYSDVARVGREDITTLSVRPAVLLAELSMELRKRIMGEVLTPGYVKDELGIESEISISQMDILLCLNEDEWKYLPLWAGGLDDGSGGVFAEVDVPDMEAIEGFRGGKMGLGNVPGGEGSVGGSFSMAGDTDDFDEVMTDEGVSTVGKASRIATDGTTSAGASTVMSLDE